MKNTNLNWLLPDGLVARYDHQRWVSVAVNVEYSEARGEVTLASNLILMSRWEVLQARDSGLHAEIFPNGGVTVCRIYERDAVGLPGTLVAEGEAHCSYTDNYVKALGRIKALGMAISALPKELMS